MMSDDSIVDKQLEKDLKLLDEFEKTEGESNKLYELLQKRHILFQEGYKLVSKPIMKAVFGNARDFVANRILIYKVRKEFEEQISQIVSRLDDLENRIKKFSFCLSNQALFATIFHSSQRFCQLVLSYPYFLCVQYLHTFTF